MKQQIMEKGRTTFPYASIQRLIHLFFVVAFKNATQTGVQVVQPSPCMTCTDVRLRLMASALASFPEMLCSRSAFAVSAFSGTANSGVHGIYLQFRGVSPLLLQAYTAHLGFEHAPVTPEQREQVREMARRMHQAEALFLLSPAAECRLERVLLTSDVLDAALLDPSIPLDSVQASEGQADTGGHGDLDAKFFFICGKPENLNSLDVLLFSAYPGMKRISAQAVTPKGQRSANLTPRRNQVKW